MFFLYFLLFVGFNTNSSESTMSDALDGIYCVSESVIESLSDMSSSDFTDGDAE